MNNFALQGLIGLLILFVLLSFMAEKLGFKKQLHGLYKKGALKLVSPLWKIPGYLFYSSARSASLVANHLKNRKQNSKKPQQPRQPRTRNNYRRSPKQRRSQP